MKELAGARNNGDARERAGSMPLGYQRFSCPPKYGILDAVEARVRKSQEQSLFVEMVEVGDRLIDAQSREEAADRLFSQKRTEIGMREWKAARAQVEKLAAEYLVAVRKWRASVDEVAERLSRA